MPRPSPKLDRASLLFGVQLAPPTAQSRADHARALIQAAPGALADILAHRITCITGPSGAGKSTLLRALVALRSSTTIFIAARPFSRRAFARPLIDSIPASFARTLDALARAGLGEAALLALTPRDLSVGQRARACIARAITIAIRAAARPPSPDPNANTVAVTPRRIIIVIDEFASGLDRDSANNLACAIRRWFADDERLPANLHLVLASADDNLISFIQPDVVLSVGNMAVSTIPPAVPSAMPTAAA